MQSHTLSPETSQIKPPPRLRALVEILNGGELVVYPIALSDTDAKLILDGLRFVTETEDARAK